MKGNSNEIQVSTSKDLITIETSPQFVEVTECLNNIGEIILKESNRSKVTKQEIKDSSVSKIKNCSKNKENNTSSSPNKDPFQSAGENDPNNLLNKENTKLNKKTLLGIKKSTLTKLFNHSIYSINIRSVQAETVWKLLFIRNTAYQKGLF